MANTLEMVPLDKMKFKILMITHLKTGLVTPEYTGRFIPSNIAPSGDISTRNIALDGEEPVVVWSDKPDVEHPTVYWYSNADTIMMNADSSYIFERCVSLTSIDISNWDTSNVTSTKLMFVGCASLTSLDLVSNWNTSNVTNMSGMFAYCTSLTSIDLSNWNTSKVDDMSSMFDGCSSLTSLNISNWDTSGVTNMSGMFAYCTSLTSIDLSNWNIDNMEDMAEMFTGCTLLTKIICTEETETKIKSFSDTGLASTVVFERPSLST